MESVESTKNPGSRIKPWNVWRGLTEGDMAEELARYDTPLEGPQEALDALYEYHREKYLQRALKEPEWVRIAWWYAIGEPNSMGDTSDAL